MKAIQNSALWAAYGDALGFISELVDEKGLKRRVGNSRVTRTIPWKRLVGGRFGAEVPLPAGCYSDDTQLRLATSRAIQSDGQFDVEAFAKVELPVWLSYTIGGGRGTKIAASCLGNQNTNWFSNFFDRNKIRYVDCGGNGVAMRIQPHVWALGDEFNSKALIGNVVRNAVCTHGHLRGILGAVFHAMCLAETIKEGSLPSPEVWKHIVSTFPKTKTVIQEDTNLATFWLPAWEDRTKVSIDMAINTVKEECLNDITIVERFVSNRSDENYSSLVKSIGGLKRESRGSGTKTAIMASALSWMYRDENPADAMITAANLLQSDTDTIATMAGALLGAVTNEPPVEEIMDRSYIEKDSTRLFKIGEKKPVDNFTYPDLMKWQPPKTQSDAVGLVNQHIGVAGLGTARPNGIEYEGRGESSAVWQWLNLDFGQLILAKKRSKLRPIAPQNLPVRGIKSKVTVEHIQTKDSDTHDPKQPALFPQEKTDSDRRGKMRESGKTIHHLTSDAIKSGFDSNLIGKHILQLSEYEDGIEKAVGYVAIIAKARIARRESRNNK